MKTVPMLAILAEMESARVRNGTRASSSHPARERRPSKKVEFRPGLRVKVLSSPCPERPALARWRRDGDVAIDLLSPHDEIQPKATR